jgi:tetratricopeptide (TPR) repeat protein
MAFPSIINDIQIQSNECHPVLKIRNMMNHNHRSLKIKLLYIPRAIVRFLLPTLLLVACDSLEPNKALKEFKIGNEQYFDFDFVDAQTLYESALELNPDLPMVRNNLACAKFRQENFKLSIDDWDVITTDFPKFAKAYYNRAIAHSYQHNFTDAIEDLDVAIQIYQAKLESTKAICKKLSNSNQIRQTIERLHIDTASCLCCEVLVSSPDWEEASEEEIDEGRTSATYYGSRIGRLNLPATDRLQFRTIWLQNALAYAHMKRGLFMQQLKSYQGAIDDYNKTLELNRHLLPSDRLKTEALHLNLGNCYQALAIKKNSESGDSLYARAIESYVAATISREDTAINWEPYYQLAVCKLGLSRSKKNKDKDTDLIDAAYIFSSLIDNQPNDPRLYTKLGNCYQAQNKLQDAIQRYSEALDLNPNQPDAVFNRGICFDALDQQSLAIADYTACIKMKPGYANAWYLRGITRTKQGDLEGAKGDLEMAGEKGHPSAFKMLGKLEKLKRSEAKEENPKAE